MVVLTGADGFLGGFVLKELRSRNHDVLAIVHKLKPHYKNARGLSWVEAELAEASSLSNLSPVEGGIIHLACSLSLDSREVLDIDVAGINSLLENWGKGPFIYLSSSDVYGKTGSGLISENSKLRPNNWYGMGKVMCEQVLQIEANIRRRKDFTILRPPFILGQDTRFYGSFIGGIIEDCCSEKDIALPLTSPKMLEQTGHSWISAKNLAQWTVASLENKLFGTFNVANDFILWKDLVLKIIQKTNSKSRLKFSSGEGETASPFAMIKNLSTELINKHCPIDLQTIDEVIDEIIVTHPK